MAWEFILETAGAAMVEESEEIRRKMVPARRQRGLRNGNDQLLVALKSGV